MKNSRILAAASSGVALLAAGAALGAPPATATPAPNPDFSLRAPSIVEIGGTRLGSVSQHIIRGGDRAPVFTVLAGDSSQVGHSMVLTDLVSGETICSAEVKASLLASCTPTRAFPLGEALPTAAIDDGTGDDDVSQNSRELRLRFAWEDPTIRLDSYDPATRTARVSGHTVADRISVNNAGSQAAARLDPATGDWHAELRVIDPIRSIDAVVAVDDVVSRGSVWLPEARSPKPTVTSTATGSLARLHIDGLDEASVRVTDIAGRFVAEGILGPSGTDIDFPVPGHETQYAVTQNKRGGPDSEPVTVVVHEGVPGAAPDAPGVGAPQASDSRTVIPVRGVPGGVVQIRSLDGRLVAVKAVGAGGSAQISIPHSSARSTSAFTAEQTVDHAISPSSLFAVSDSATSPKDHS